MTIRRRRGLAGVLSWPFCSLLGKWAAGECGGSIHLPTGALKKYSGAENSFAKLLLVGNPDVLQALQPPRFSLQPYCAHGHRAIWRATTFVPLVAVTAIIGDVVKWGAGVFVGHPLEPNTERPVLVFIEVGNPDVFV